MPHSAEALSPAAIVRSGLCIGCGACATDARATIRWDAHGFLKADGPADWYEAPSEAFAARCPFSPRAASEDAIAVDRFPEAPAQHTALGRYEAAYVGAAAEPPFREQGSSGGLVTWVAAELLRSKAVDAVAHVIPSDPESDGGFFRYTLSRDMDALNRGAKSRYHPIELSGVLRTIRGTPGRYAVVGIPCFIKAVHLARRQDPVLAERITHTLGLFCGHMKSARMVESFAWQTGHAIGEVAAVDYRLKDAGRPANWYRAHLTLKAGGTAGEDWWNLADGDWGAGFFQASACDWCDDVMAETADMSFGDAWVEPYSSDGRGTNVAVVRSPELHALVEAARADGRLTLEQVDAEFVANTQAAGLRHRREGLAYRLTWAKAGIRPVKRVAPSAGGLPWRRKLVYRTRYAIGRWSNRMFALARRLRRPALYTRWARAALTFYAGITWSRGWVGRVADRLERKR